MKQFTNRFKHSDTDVIAERFEPNTILCAFHTIQRSSFSCNKILNHLDTHSILTQYRHGFCKAHSFESQLLLTVLFANNLMCSYDKKIQTDVAILDFFRAFDTVPHERLLGKLDYLASWEKNPRVDPYILRPMQPWDVGGRGRWNITKVQGWLQSSSGTCTSPLIIPVERRRKNQRLTTMFKMSVVT